MRSKFHFLLTASFYPMSMRNYYLSGILKRYTKTEIAVLLRLYWKRTVSQSSPYLHKSGFVIGTMAFLSYSIFRATSWSEFIISLITELLGPGLVAFLVHYRKECLIRWYDQISIFAQVLISLGLVVRPADGNHTPINILLRHSPVTAMFLVSVFFPTKFWSQFWGQLAGSIVTFPWTYNICSNKDLSAGLSEGINTALWNLQVLFSIMFVSDHKTSYRYPCVVSLGFVHYALVFVIPCSLKYIIESQTRANYLAARLPQIQYHSIMIALWENTRFCWCITVFSLVLIIIGAPLFEG